MIDETLKELRKTVGNYDNEAVVYWAKKAVEEGIDPVKSLEILTKAMREIGDGYSKGDFFLPDLIGGAEVVKNAMPTILEEFRRRGQKRKVKVLLLQEQYLEISIVLESLWLALLLKQMDMRLQLL